MPPQPAPAGKRRKPLNLGGILGRRLPLVLAVGALCGAVLAPLLSMLGGASYRTEGVLLIDPGKEPTLTGRERDVIPGNIGDYTRTLVSRMTSGDVLLAALHAVPKAQWPVLLSEPGLDPALPDEVNAARFGRALKVKEVPRTFLMSVEIEGQSARGLAPALNAVLDAFVAKLGREAEQQHARRLEYLRAEREQIVTRLETERTHILQLADKVSSKAFLHQSYTVHLSTLEQVQRMYWEAEAERVRREGELRRALADEAELPRLSLQAYADERVADNFGINRIEQWTYEQLQGLRSNIDGLTTNNTDRTYVEDRMTAMNQYLTRYKQEVNETTIRVMNEKRLHDLEVDVIKASNALASARGVADALGQRLATTRTEASDTSEAIFNAGDITFNITQLRERLGAINTRIDDCEMEAKAPLRISVDRAATAPTRPAKNTRPQLALLAIVLGFGLVFAGVLAFEILDDRVRGPSDVDAALGAPAPDPVPRVRGGGLERVLLDAPDSPAGTALRALAVRLHRATLRHGARLFAFSGLTTGGGNTSLALNVAQALSRHAPRVLVLGLGRSGLLARAGVSKAPEGTALLRDPDGIDAAIVADTARGIDLAEIMLNGDPLPSKVGLGDLVRNVRARYDAVVLDLGAVPDDDLALAALHHVDGVVLTVREDGTMFRSLRRALDAAAAAGVPALTALLNSTRSRPPGWLHARIQRGLRPVSLFHRRAAEEWNRRLRRPQPGGRP